MLISLTLYEIMGKIAPLLKHRMKARNSFGSHIPLKTRLAVTLCCLAGASYIDLCFAWGISSTSFYSKRGVL
jgi:hypothetical protein